MRARACAFIRGLWRCLRWKAVHSSGRAGAGGFRWWRGWCWQCGRRCAGRIESTQAHRPVEDVAEQIGAAAAMADDDEIQFAPQRVVRHDAEIAADVGDDDAERAAADRG